MRLSDYTEEFTLYRRVFEKADFSELQTSWEVDGMFKGAITLRRESESRIPGGAQNINSAEICNLYVPVDDKFNLPEYDDFVKRLKDGVFYRVISNSNSRRTPRRAAFEFSIYTIERAEFPGKHDKWGEQNE